MYKRRNPLRVYGIDESNNGKLPEVFVASESQSLSDITPTTGLEKKLTNATKEELSKFHRQGLNKFSFTIVTKDDYNIYLSNDPHLKNLFGLYTLIQSIEKKEREGIVLYVDGLIESEILGRLYQLLEEDKEDFRIVSCPKGDITFPVIYRADVIARHISGYLNGFPYNSSSNKERRVNRNKGFQSLPESLRTNFIVPNYVDFLNKIDKKPKKRRSRGTKKKSN